MLFISKPLFVLKLILLFLPVLQISQLFSQDYRIGIPFITSFSEKDFVVSNQNWDIVQDSRQVMYFANDYGILEFDGSNWSIIQVPLNRSITRSLAFGHNRLYVGGQDFMGFIDTENGSIAMNSLVDLLPRQEQNFGTIWKIFNINNRILFFSWNALFIYNGSSFKIIKTPHPFKSCFKVGNRIFIHGDELYELKADSLESLSGGSFFKDRNIAFITGFTDDELLIGFDDGKMVKYNFKSVTPFYLSDTTILNNNRFLCGIHLNNSMFLAGTTDKGLIVFDRNGVVYKHITKSDGLGHNHIKQVFEDKIGNWWILNEKGIDIVEASSPLYNITIDPENPFSVYTSFLFKDKIFAGSHSGLYCAPWNRSLSKLTFDKIPGTGDICWKLDTLGDRLYLCTADGLYEITTNKANHIFNGIGVWTLIRPSRHPEIVLAGTYEGLIMFRKKGESLKFVKKLSGFSETSRVAEEDKDGNIWISHGLKGVYKIVLSAAADSIKEVHFYNSRKGFPSDLFINVFKINDEIIFGTQNGVYKYDKKSDSVVVHPIFGPLLGTSGQVKYMRQDTQGRIWCIAGEVTKILTMNSDGSFSILNVPARKLSLDYYPGFENIFFFENGNALFGTKSGLVFFNYQIPFQPDNDFNLLITGVTSQINHEVLYDERLAYFGDSTQVKKVVIPFNQHSIRFDYTACYYENISLTDYASYLEGYDEEWSDWTDTRFREFTNLSPGRYAFHVKAKNVYEKESKENVFRFTILPPWYKKTVAYSMYILVAFLIIWIFFRLKTRHFEQEKKKIIEEQEKAREIDQIKYHEERLMIDLENKNKELAASAMKIIYKNEKMLEIKKLLENISPETKMEFNNQLDSIKHFIEKELKDDHWEDFELRFDQANNNFIQKLKELYPDLSHSDLKICAYLRMNLSTKEIAQILNMSIRGVETARFRIRKRMGLEQTDNLNDFILRL
ncbi:MAG: hypothetical protein JXJ22_04640 [Bacteroidales bacterium]|nr:hypothetical protein [Bacteroidales bacterium]